MTFVSDDDWKGCIEDVVNMQRKKKDITPSITMILNNVVSITVFIALPVYSNFWLVSCQSKKAKSYDTGSKKSKAKAKIIDLDQSDNDSDDVEGIHEMEQQHTAVAELKKSAPHISFVVLALFARLGIMALIFIFILPMHKYGFGYLH